jgi:hypothetical protein
MSKDFEGIAVDPEAYIDDYNWEEPTPEAQRIAAKNAAKARGKKAFHSDELYKSVQNAEASKQRSRNRKAARRTKHSTALIQQFQLDRLAKIA